MDTTTAVTVDVRTLRGVVKTGQRERALKALNLALPRTDGRVSLDHWLRQTPEAFRALTDENGDGVLEGIYCGRTGRMTRYIPSLDAAFVLGWYEGKVEYAYLA